MQGPWEPPRGDPWQLEVISQGGLLLVNIPTGPAQPHLPALRSAGPLSGLPVILASSGLLSCGELPKKARNPRVQASGSGRGPVEPEQVCAAKWASAPLT